MESKQKKEKKNTMKKKDSQHDRVETQARKSCFPRIGNWQARKKPAGPATKQTNIYTLYNMNRENNRCHSRERARRFRERLLHFSYKISVFAREQQFFLCNSRWRLSGKLKKIRDEQVEGRREMGNSFTFPVGNKAVVVKLSKAQR
jgi:hypothetical protein